MPVRPLLALGSLAALALVLAGCAGASPSPDASSDGSDGPLSRYLATVWGSDVDESEMQAQNQQIEELVATCMSDEGFEYSPQTQNMQYSSGEEWKPDDREWVAQWGYGATEWPGQDDMQTDQAIDDPNAEYVSALSESEATAYYEVLYGPQPTQEELDANDGSWSPSWEEQGCYGRASHEVNGEDPTQSDAHKPIMDAINDFYSAQYDEASTATADIDAEWADCMAGGGHSGLTRQQDAAQSIYDAQTAIYEKQTGDADLSPEIDALHEEEVELALADLDCREEVDYTARTRAVQWAAEEQFIADHKAELDALVADAEQARADG